MQKQARHPADTSLMPCAVIEIDQAMTDEPFDKIYWAENNWFFVSEKLKRFIDVMELSVANHLGAQAVKVADKREIIQRGKTVPLCSEEVDILYGNIGMDTVMRRAAFLMVFGIFEHHVRNICARVRAKSPHERGPVPQKYLDTFRKILIEELGLKGDSLGKDYDFLESAKDVRDVIAHRAAQLDSRDQSDWAKPTPPDVKEKRALEFIELNKEIKVDKGGGIDLTRDFLPAFIDAMDRAFRGIVDLVREKYPGARRTM